jgi:hypothetical protein
MESFKLRIEMTLLKRLARFAKRDGNRTLASLMRHILLQWADAQDAFAKQGKQ